VSAPILEWIDAGDPRMTEVHVLRHVALFAPFGLTRDDRWGDEGHDRRHLVMLRDAVVVGYACMILTPEREGHVRQVSVRPDLQGTGLGRALMAEVEVEAVRLGLRLLWLNARTAAEPFYRRLGYETVSGTFPSGRTGIPHVRMERRLSR
jgi:N-acetylglutamate synthase-like GNAT family acetyltransferase